MSQDQDDVLRVGDIAEFHRSGYPQPLPEWQAQRVREVRILEEYDDKEGVSVSQVSWSAVRNYECLVLVVGTGNWGRNEDLRPVSSTSHKK